MAARANRQGTRSRRRQAALDAAARVQVPGRVDVCVVGGGAAGLAAAVTAAEAGARTLVLERQPECGRTILATGGGRCNFANRDLAPACYNDPTFVEAVVGDDFLGQVLGFFRSCGMAWTEEQGRLYPLSLSAASVRHVLLARARAAGAVLAPGREVIRAGRDEGLLRVWFEGPGGVESSVGASCLLLASGGGDALHGVRLNRHPTRPALCPIACTGLPFARLDGQRVRAEARLMRRGREVTREQGEFLFRDYGLSGIAAFNLSRHVQTGDLLELDLVPSLEAEQVSYLAGRAGSLAGMLAPQVAEALEQEGLDPKHARLTVRGLAQTELAQVTRGGYATSGFDPATLAAASQPGVFAAGEALDVDGPCGGYNLAWAWASGIVAGRSAAERALAW